MTTSCNDLVQRAIGFSVQNNASGLTSSAPEMLTRLGQYESDLYALAATHGRYFYASGTVTSTAGASDRTADLSTLATLERVIRATCAAGTLNRVDIEDVDAELAPRYYLLGQTMTEVGSDWGASGAVTITVQFATRPAALDPTAGLSQTVTIPDRWAPILSIQLAAYLSRKDVGRDPAEAQALDAQAQSEIAAMLASMEHLGGISYRRFVSPAPMPKGSG